MILRAIAAFLILPAMVAGAVPAAIAMLLGEWGPPRPAGIAVLGIGALLLVWCVRDFFVMGRGTLAPWDPPRHLVVAGLYRFVRNPMYLAVLTILAGWALALHSAWLLGYAVTAAFIFHIRVLRAEEPALQSQFGSEWEAYRAATPRWIPGLRR